MGSVYVCLGFFFFFFVISFGWIRLGEQQTTIQDKTLKKWVQFKKHVQWDRGM